MHAQNRQNIGKEKVKIDSWN